MNDEQRSRLEEALALYPLSSPKGELIRHNENMTFQVADGNGRYVLRIHQPVEGFSLEILRTGGDKRQAIQSEMELLSALKIGSPIPVQSPFPCSQGGLVATLADGTPVTLLEWIVGETLENTELTPDLCRSIGEMTAGLHAFFAQNRAQHTSLARYRYDRTLLPPIAERIRRAEQGGYIRREAAQSILSALEEMDIRFCALDETQEPIIVHADLSKSNMILCSDGRIAPIDFSLCGISHTYMDVGGLLGHVSDDADRFFILEGYKNVHGGAVNIRFVEPYFALNVILFIACQYERSKEWDWYSDAIERWCKDIFSPLAANAPFLLT